MTNSRDILEGMKRALQIAKDYTDRYDKGTLLDNGTPPFYWGQFDAAEEIALQIEKAIGKEEKA